MLSCIPGLYLKAHATGASLETSNHPESGKSPFLQARSRHEGVMKQQETLDKMNEGYI